MWETTRDNACTLVIYMEPPHCTKPVLMSEIPAASDVREVKVWAPTRTEGVRRSNCSIPGESMERRVRGCDNVGGGKYDVGADRDEDLERLRMEQVTNYEVRGQSESSTAR
jgi:hypothetical protein